MMARVVDQVLGYSPLQPLMRWRHSRSPRILAYHGIDDAENFERQVRYLVRRHVPLSLDQVLDAMDGGAELPRHAVLVTFDDGDRSVLESGLPILRAHGVPAVAFVIAGLLDGSTPFWWVEAETLVRRGATIGGAPAPGPAETVRMMKRVPDARRLELLEELRATAGGEPVRTPQLRRAELPVMRAGGIEIGNHTLTHPCLDRCTPAAAGREVEEAHRVLTEACGEPPRAFAYPNGNFDPAAAEALRRLGYRAAFLFDHRVGAFPPASPLGISRVRVNTTDGMDRFRILVSGVHPAVHHGLGRA